MTTTRNLDFDLGDIKLANPPAADPPLVGSVLQRTNSSKGAGLSRGTAATAGLFALLAAAAAGAAFLMSRPHPAAPPQTRIAAQPAPASTPTPTPTSATPTASPEPAGPLASDAVSEPAPPPVRRIRAERDVRHAARAGSVEAPVGRPIRATPAPEPVTPVQPAAQAPAVPLDQPAAPQPPASQPAASQPATPQPAAPQQAAPQPQPQAPQPQSSAPSPQA